MKKRFLLAAIIAVGIFIFGGMTASAEQNGVFTYEVSNRQVTITGCDTSASGKIVIPETMGGYPVTTIIDGVFYGCEAITSIEIPSSVTTIEYRNDEVSEWTFGGCISLTSIIVDKNNTVYSSENGLLLSKDKTVLIACPAGLTNVTIPDSVTTIGYSAFYSCINLESIVIPGTVKTIGSIAFEYCIRLESLEIQDGVENIEYHAFNNCRSLTSIEIPKSVTTIGISAFNSCTNLTRIEIPDSVISIGEWAFNNTGYYNGLDDTPYWDGNSLYIGKHLIEVNNTVSGTYIIEDETINIANRAFEPCEGLLTSVVIPSSVKSIGKMAFGYFASLTDVYYTGTEEEWNKIEIDGDNETLLNVNIHFNYGKEPVLTYEISGGEVTITGCDDAVSGAIVIPETIEGYPVTSIGDYAFYNCTSLTGIEIPDGVTTIGEFAFWECIGLTSIVIPDSVTEISSHAFTDCTGLTSVVIGRGVASIWNYAFFGCTGLISIEIPDSVTHISSGAFYGCISLISIIVDEKNTVYSSENGLLLSKDKTTLYLCPKGLENVIIPNSVKSIGDFAFYGCKGLTSVTIGKDLTYVGPLAFEECESLSDVYYTGTEAEWNEIEIIEIEDGNEALLNANIHFNYGKEPEDKPVLKYEISGDAVTITDCDALVSGALVIPETIEGYPVTSIGKSAFDECTGLTSIEIPEGVTSIGDYAFYNCTSLTSIIVDEDNTVYSSENGLLLNKKKTTLLQCGGGLETLEIPDSVTGIGDRAFGDCTKLTSIKIPDSVTSIGERAFWGCTKLTSIVIPDGVTNIADGAFVDCTSLTSIEIPDGVTGIGMDAFGGCTKLTGIEIPNSVTYIGDRAFEYCTGLTSIAIPSARIEFLAFYRCTGLESVEIAAGASMDPQAFEGCTGLTSIIVDEKHTDYSSKNGLLLDKEKRTLIMCPRGIKNVTIPDSVTSIEQYAFNGCTKLTRIEIPDSVTSIGDSAFWECIGLTSIVIPDSVTSIGGCAFSGCYGLSDVYYSGTEEEWNKIEIEYGNEEFLNANIHFNYVEGSEEPEDDVVTNVTVDRVTGDIFPESGKDTVSITIFGKNYTIEAERLHRIHTTFNYDANEGTLVEMGMLFVPKAVVEEAGISATADAIVAAGIAKDANCKDLPKEITGGSTDVVFKAGLVDVPSEFKGKVIIYAIPYYKLSGGKRRYRGVVETTF